MACGVSSLGVHWAKCLPFQEQGFSPQIPDPVSTPRSRGVGAWSRSQVASPVENLTHLRWEPGGPCDLVGTADLKVGWKRPFLIFLKVAFLWWNEHNSSPFGEVSDKIQSRRPLLVTPSAWGWFCPQLLGFFRDIHRDVVTQELVSTSQYVEASHSQRWLTMWYLETGRGVYCGWGRTIEHRNINS